MGLSSTKFVLLDTKCSGFNYQLTTKRDLWRRTSLIPNEPTFRQILIANRGKIACGIITTTTTKWDPNCRFYHSAFKAFVRSIGELGRVYVAGFLRPFIPLNQEETGQLREKYRLMNQTFETKSECSLKLGKSPILFQHYIDDIQ